MSYIGQAPGQGQRVPFRFVATAGQTTFSGPDVNGYPFGYTPGLVDVFVKGALQPSTAYTAGDGSTLVLGTAASAGDVILVLAQAPFSPANTYTMTQVDSFQRRRNRIIDPGMRLSQENSNNSLTLTSGTSMYASDSIFAYRSGSGGATFQRVALTTPGGSPYRVRATVTSVNASPAANDQLALNTRIEGIDVADLKFGTTSAKTIAVRFGCRVSVAGTYAVAILNGATNRSWVGSVTIAAGEVGQDVVKSVTLVGDQTGTWAIDNTTGLQLCLALCCGSSVQGVAGWQAGTFIAPAGYTNLMATNGATFDLFDVGLYDVTGLQSGIIPPFELENFWSDYARCRRYFSTIYTDLVGYGGTGSGSAMESTAYTDVPMRANPTITLIGGGTRGGVSSTQLIAMSPNALRLILTLSANGSVYSIADVWSLNARL